MTEPADDIVLKDWKQIPPEVWSELEELVVEITDGFHQGSQIDWDDVWDRLEKCNLKSGQGIDIPDLSSSAQEKLKRYVRNLRAKG